jgi:hypothetical protein
VLSRLASVFVALICVAGIVAYQVHEGTRPAAAAGNPSVFVPSPKFYTDFSPSFRTSIADAYWLQMIQYYGEHWKTDHHFNSLPAMVDLVTMLSPHFKQAYFFSAFALIDAGRPDLSYRLLQAGFAANPTDWHFPFYLGFFTWAYASNKDRRHVALVAANYYSQAAKLPGALPSVPRLAAALLAKGGDKQKAIETWATIYGQGDKYSQQKAIAALDALLPQGKQERISAVAALRDLMPADRYRQLSGALLVGYQ